MYVQHMVDATEGVDPDLLQYIYEAGTRTERWKHVGPSLGPSDLLFWEGLEVGLGLIG